MVELRVLTLGAGQDVGRSCVVVNIGGRTIMFDCGMHMGYQDERRYPDFKMISRNGNYTQAIDAVIVTHFHLDHCGALPFFTEACGYDGPIYMTYPTKAIVPVMLEDFHKVLVDRRGEGETFSRKGISDCMRKVTPVDLHQTVRVAGAPDIELRAYYAGHVLGAAMFHVRVGNESIVYTGDYNMTPDRHLGAAHIERLRPDLLITETTYATTIRDSKRARERDFLTQVHETVDKGGKVLIPVYAVGRAQELCLLLDEYWERMNLDVPIYLSAGMTAKANMYYKLLVNWTSEKIKGAPAGRNAFGFARMRQWERGFMDRPGPCVLFATPGMLHGGTSLEVFKAWAPGEQNMVILPGYCVAGTVGSKLMANSGKILDVDKRTKLNVACKVRYLSFSAHADAKGIMGLIQQCAPRHVMLVHGEQQKMEFLSKKIAKTFRLRVFMPPNGTVITMKTSGAVPVAVSRRLVSEALHKDRERKRLAASAHQSAPGRDMDEDGSPESASPATKGPTTRIAVSGILMSARGEDGVPATALLANDEFASVLGVTELKMSLGAEVEVHCDAEQREPVLQEKHKSAKPLKKRRLQDMEKAPEDMAKASPTPAEAEVLEAAVQHLRESLTGAGRCSASEVVLEAEESSVCIESFRAILSRREEEPPLPGRWEFSCSWLMEHDDLAQLCLAAMESLRKTLHAEASAVQ